MTRRSSALIAACLGVMVAGTVHGQARNAPVREPGRQARVRVDPVTQHAAELTQIDSWLRSLVGQYRLSLDGTSLDGTADCAGIGIGPGVHCIFGLGAPGQSGRRISTMLFGVDIEGPQVHRFQLNADSTAETGAARLRGDAVTFHVRQCPVIQRFPATSPDISLTVLFCRRETRVHVVPDGRFVRIRQSTFEGVLVRRAGRSEIREFPSRLELTLERVQAQ